MKSSLLPPLCLLLAVAGCSQSPGPSAAAAAAPSAAPGTIRLGANNPTLSFLKIEKVKADDAAPTLTFTGKVAFDEDHTQRLASPIDGRVTDLLANPGDKVKVGQSLLRLSSPNVGLLQADAQKATQDLSVAQKSLDRAHKLQEDGAIADKDVAQTEADFRKAKSDVGRTSAQLRALGVSASDPAITVALRAQIAGTLVERNVLVGQEVRQDSATPLMTISNLDSVWVLADVYEQDLKVVHQGDLVDVRVPAYPEQSFPGTVGHLGDVLDPVSHTVKVRCIVPNPDGRLKPEMFAKAMVSNAKASASLSISSKAILADTERTRVIVETSEGVFKMRTVSVGPEIDGRVRVFTGLEPGELVVTEGALFLKGDIDGQ